MDNVSICVPRVSSNSSGFFWRFFKIGLHLTQDPLKLLLLPWVPERVTFWLHFKSGVSIFHSFPECKHYWPSKPDILGAGLPSAGLPAFLIFLSLWVIHLEAWVLTTPLLLLPISLWFLLYIFSYIILFSGRFWSFSLVLLCKWL